MSEKCGNCGIYREVKDGIVEQCPNCGDDEYELGENNPYPENGENEPIYRGLTETIFYNPERD